MLSLHALKSPTETLALSLTQPKLSLPFLPLSFSSFPSLSAATPATDAPSTASASSAVPTPVVVIDNTSDSFATVVTVKYGGLLGELLDTTAALKSLGLNIRKAKVSAADGSKTFFITDAATSEKVICGFKRR